MGGGDNEGILDLFCMKLNEVLRVKKLYAREVKEYWNIDIGLGHAKKVRNIAREGKKEKNFCVKTYWERSLLWKVCKCNYWLITSKILQENNLWLWKDDSMF